LAEVTAKITTHLQNSEKLQEQALQRQDQGLNAEVVKNTSSQNIVLCMSKINIHACEMPKLFFKMPKCTLNYNAE